MRTLFALLIILIAASCTKFGKNVTLKGQVLNPVTGEGIEGAEVKLLKIVGGYDSKYKTIKSATTDASGNFDLDKYTWVKPVARCEVGDLYALGWTQDGGQTFIDNFELDVKKGKVMHADFYAVPYSFIRLDIHNVSCQGATDHFVLYSEGTQVDMTKVGLMIDETGCYDYAPSSYTKLPMGGRYYRWEVTKSGITTIFHDTIYLSEGEYKTFTINY